MRSARYALKLCILLLAIPCWGKQLAQSTSTPQPTSDPQALAVVQAAITALGGTTAISQAQSWIFQAQMQGPHGNGSINYQISTDADTGYSIEADGSHTPGRMTQSYFLPLLVGPILLKELQDPDFTFFYEASPTGSNSVTITVMFSGAGAPFEAQFWTFDATRFPVRIDFRLPAEIGAKRSYPVVVALSDYQSISGVFYPFHMTTAEPWRLSQIITLQSVTTNATALPNDFNGLGGDVQ